MEESDATNKSISKTKEDKKDYHKKYYIKNKNKLIEYSKNYQLKNENTYKKYQKKYRKENKEELRIKQNIYIKIKRKNNPLYRMSMNIRRRMQIALKYNGYKKKEKTLEILGTDWETATTHIESTFTEGMSWDNYGEWHIDHIIPIASANTEEEILSLCNYKNLQALWALDNIRKKDKF